jgi:hypothetical protein
MESEERDFGMHHNLLYNVIMRQAGTLQKAVLEGVMNAIDAGATTCRIELTTHKLSITDDGHGFQSREEIEEFFETFGTPHVEGDATFGHYRMGRGQIMSFGGNVWRSRNFEMKVDMKSRSSGYKLFEHNEDFPGTRVEVELYDPMLPSNLQRTLSEIRNFVAWAQIPVILNGENISKKPETAKWTHEDENAYYSLSSERQQLSIYNLGVLVVTTYSGRFGMGGTVVSKKPLEVNFARNDIQSTCPIGSAIAAFIKKEAKVGATKKTRLTDAERDIMVSDMLAGGTETEEAFKLRVITDVYGRSWPISKLLKVVSNFSGKLIVAQRGDLLVETAQHRGYVFSIDEATLERFGASDAEGFKSRMIKFAQTNAEIQDDKYFYRHQLRLMANVLEKIQIVERDDLKVFVSDDYIPIINKDLTPDQKVLLSCIERGYAKMIQVLNKAAYEDQNFERRSILFGRSDSALAWTDGSSTIWIDVEYARRLRLGHSGATQLAMLLLHETIHEGPDTGTHQHDHAFYQAYHDMSTLYEDPIGMAAETMITTLMSKLRLGKKKVSQALLARDDLDQMIATIRAEKLDEPADDAQE